uniref:Uncharacterized protein n=1 Tax=Parascaris univalens TaxID=6257 RepID=A0A915BFJ6_PARUN
MNTHFCRQHMLMASRSLIRHIEFPTFLQRVKLLRKLAKTGFFLSVFPKIGDRKFAKTLYMMLELLVHWTVCLLRSRLDSCAYSFFPRYICFFGYFRSCY